MDDTILTPDGTKLAAHLARPTGSARVPALVLCHGFPTPPRGALASGLTFPELGDRISREAGWCVLTFNFRGSGGSEGDFSASGWIADQHAAVSILEERDDTLGVWLAGFGLGGTLGICAAAEDERVRGVATVAAQASLREWSRDPARLLAQARQLGVLKTPDYPPEPVPWAREIGDVDPVAAAAALAPRPLLVIHGSDDDEVPPSAPRAIVEAHGSAELRIVPNAGHRLRHDPRAVASLLGWLSRQELA